jgi:hypothetical protein
VSDKMIDPELHIQLRPALLTDLPVSDRHGDLLMEIHIGALPIGKLMRQMAVVLETAQSMGLLIEQGSYSTTIYSHPSQEAIEDRLNRAARDWDLARDQYEAVSATGNEPNEWDIRNRLTGYCAKMGLALPWSRG